MTEIRASKPYDAQVSRTIKSLEAMKDFERATLMTHYRMIRYAFNLNYLAVYHQNIVKLISLGTGQLIHTLYLESDIYTIAENELLLFIILNSPTRPQALKIIESFDFYELMSLNMFEKEGSIIHRINSQGINVFMKNHAEKGSEAVLIVRG